MEATTELLRRDAVTPEEFKRIAEQLEGTQLDIKLRRGAVTYKLGTVIRVTVGRDALMAHVAFNPGMKLVTEGEGEEIKPLYVEWVPRG